MKLASGKEWAILEPSGTILEVSRSQFHSLAWLAVIRITFLLGDQLRKLGYKEVQVDKVSEI